MSDLIADAIREHWGERCPDFDPECWCCRAWAEYDEITRLRAENERLRAALREVMDDLTLISKNHWLPVGLLDDVIYVNARAALDAFSAPKSGWAPTDGQKQLDAARYSGNIAHAPLPPAPGKEEA